MGMADSGITAKTLLRDRHIATSDHIKGLFRAFSKRDDPALITVANDLIVEEKQKGHSILARDLENILSNGTAEIKTTRFRVVQTSINREARRDSVDNG